MKRLACVSFLLVLVVTSLTTAQTRVDLRETRVLALGRRQAVLAADLSTGRPLEGRWAVYTAELPVASAATLLAGLSSARPQAVQDGGLYTVAGDGSVRATRAFASASFTEVLFPGANAANSGSDADRVTARFVANETEPGAAPAQIAPRAAGAWRSSNFRVTIGNVPCGSISAVGALTVRISAARPGAEPARQATPPASISNLTLTLRSSDAGPWYEWFERAVVDGSESAANAEEVSGTIEYLDASRQRVLLGLDLGRVRIVNIRSGVRANNSDVIASDTVELRVGSVQVR